MSMPGPCDVGVVVGRFQIAKLHPGHRQLLDLVASRHRRVLVLLGSPRWLGGKIDPLDYTTRAKMFNEEYPNFITHPITDCQTDEEWSANVDKIIRSIYPLDNATLYGGRNGFTSRYKGTYPTHTTVEQQEYSGTTERDKLSSLPRASADFRAGVIYDRLNLPEYPIMCVDAAILKLGPDWIPEGPGIEVLVVRKPDESTWRFPGGKIEPDDLTLEIAVKREAREETGVEVGVTPIYIGSFTSLPEWRAKQAGKTVASAFYALPYIYGCPRGQDDVADAKFIELENLTVEQMEDCHKPFLDILKKWVANMNQEEFFGHVKSIS